MIKKVFTLVIIVSLASCAGSPARINYQSVDEVYKENVAGRSLKALCVSVTKVKAKRYRVSNDVLNKSNKAIDMGFRETL